MLHLKHDMSFTQETISTHIYIYIYTTNRLINIFSRFSQNLEASTSKFLENLDQIFPLFVLLLLLYLKWHIPFKCNDIYFDKHVRYKKLPRN